MDSQGIKIKSEQTDFEHQSNSGIKEEVQDVEMNEEESKRIDAAESDNNEIDDDPVVNELDVFLSKNLANKIYILQYPIRPNNRTYDDAKVLNARIKPKQNRVELELDLNTNSENYSRVKGEQFAINVDGGLTSRPSQNKLGSDKNQQSSKYFRSSAMDKIMLTSSNACLGQMNRLYHLGLFKNNEDETSLHLTPVQSMVQMKPSFDYLDMAEKRLKESASSKDQEDNGGGGGAYSTEEEADSEVDSKPELVTLKYGAVGQNTQTHEQEQSWINVEFVKANETIANKLRESLECKSRNAKLKLDALSNEELIRKSVDFNLVNNHLNSSSEPTKS